MKKYILFPLLCGFLLTGCGMIHESSDTAASKLIYTAAAMKLL